MNPPLIFEGCKHDPRLSNCPYDIRGQRRSLGMMYFPILNEELFWNPQKHRVAPCVWCNFLAVMFVSLETEVTKFLQTFRNLETNHFSSNWNIPFCCFSRNIPFFLLKIRWNRLGSGAFFPGESDQSLEAIGQPICHGKCWKISTENGDFPKRKGVLR